MKLRKTKIAAAAMAAVTAISASQAITASAFSYTVVPTRTCETYAYVNNITSYLSGCYGTRANDNWYSYNSTTRREQWGPVCKNGYQGGSYSNISENDNIFDGKAFARKVARQVYNTTTFMEMREVTNSSAYNYFKYIPRIGDQVTVKYGNISKTIFITNVAGSSIYACEVDENNIIKYNNYYSYNKSTKKFTRGGKAWAFDYVARPVKLGDANGDSYVSLDGDSFTYQGITFNCKADGAEMSYIMNYGCRSGEMYNWLCAVADWTADWSIDGRDYKVFQDHMIDYSGSGLSHDGNTINCGYVLFPY